MKKIILIILLVLSTFACSKEKVFTEYKAFILPEIIEVVPGESSFVTVSVEIPEDSHIYGNPKGPGIGKITTVTPFKHKDIEFKDTRYLNPLKYFAEGEDKFVWIYKKQTSLFLPFNIKKGAKEGVYNLKLTFDSLLCSGSSCMPKVYDLDYKIKIVNKNVSKFSDEILSLFAQSKSSGDKKTFPSVIKKTDKLNSEVKVKEDDFFKGEKFTPQWIDISGISGLLQAIIFGLIAGFLLNFMPCVLPVVSLKIMSFVKHAGEEKKKLVKLGLLFSLGILVSFTFLAFLAAFFGYNWGELFQQRLFLIIMIGIIFALGLSMFGVFSINTISAVGKASKEKENPYLDAFAKGLLATLLATPCSGPFLGGTLAWALSQPPLTIFTIFISVGVGMAFPYLLLSINPKFMKFIPKPGNWMKTFEQIMGFLLLFTVIYLMSILDDKSVLPAITFLTFLLIAFWQYGKYGSIIENRRRRIFIGILTILIIVSGYFISFNYLYLESDGHLFSKDKFSIEKLYQNKNENRITIIKYTADWCPNCKLVEKMSLTEKVGRVIADNNIDFMTADLTVDNPPADKLMDLLGSKSIPFLTIIPGGDQFYSPICLRDIYSEKDVLSAIEMAVGSQPPTPQPPRGELFKLSL
jgi:thiol:disulfide interchange protein